MVAFKEADETNTGPQREDTSQQPLYSEFISVSDLMKMKSEFDEKMEKGKSSRITGPVQVPKFNAKDKPTALGGGLKLKKESGGKRKRSPARIETDSKIKVEKQLTIEETLSKNAEKRKVVEAATEVTVPAADPIPETPNPFVEPLPKAAKVHRRVPTTPINFPSWDKRRMSDMVVKNLMPIYRQKHLIRDREQFKRAARNVSAHLLRILGSDASESFL